jgi:hypothetical protein
MKQDLSDKIGQTNRSRNGQLMKIVNINENKISIQFEDGTVVKNKSYNEFLTGNIENPKFSNISYNRIGETVTAFNGQEMTIVQYRTYKDIDIMFEDQTIVCNQNYTQFKKGAIKNPKFSGNTGSTIGSLKILGDKQLTYNGKIGYRCYCKECRKEFIVTPKEMYSHIHGNIGYNGEIDVNGVLYPNIRC